MLIYTGWIMIISHYFTAKRFHDFITSNTLSFTQIRHWNSWSKSQKEGVAFNCFFTKIRNCHCIPNYISSLMLDAVKGAYYAQCWTDKPESSDMWNKFSPNKNGLLVTFDSNTVFNYIQNGLSSNYYIIDLQNVKYEKAISVSSNIFETNIDFNSLAKHFLDKSYEFVYENESRYIAYSKNVDIIREMIESKNWDIDRLISLINQNPQYINYDISSSSSIIEVTADPRISDNDFYIIKSLCDNINIPIKKSSLNIS